MKIVVGLVLIGASWWSWRADIFRSLFGIEYLQNYGNEPQVLKRRIEWARYLRILFSGFLGVVGALSLVDQLM